ncbi:MAG TPA: hypothetical protein VJM15_11045, partial [Sphingomicrobium sp.]|nr:hypothetical protein [Sphingomicrobium sp.]
AFADFRVWQDADSDGVVDAGEMQSLTALGIASISLTSDGIGYSAANGDVQVVGTGSYTRTDGSSGVLADAVFATGAAVDQKQALSTAGTTNAALIGAVAAAGLASSAPLAAMSLDAGDAGSVMAFAGVSSHVDLSPMAANAVAKLQVAEQMAVASVQRGSDLDEGGMNAAFAPAFHAQLDATVAHAPAPELLHGSDAPTVFAVGAMPLAAPTVAMPAAEQLTGVSGAQHNAVVAQVLADALDGGSAHGPDIDGLLASLPHVQPGAGGHDLAGLADGHAALGGAQLGFTVDPMGAHALVQLAAHVDAPSTV